MPASDSTGGFFEYQPSQEDLFRGVILFGRNVASYKFALGKSILELAARGEEQVSSTARSRSTTEVESDDGEEGCSNFLHH